MNRLMCFLLGVVVGVAGLHTAQNYHIVRSQDGFHLIPKHVSSLKDPYVDIRNFGVSDWAEHLELVEAIRNSEHKSLLVDAAQDGMHEAVESVIDAVAPQ